MYEKQFQFRGRPFCSIPSAEHYFPASAIDAALESTKLCIERASGPALIFGQSGWGKSQLLSVLQRDYKHRFRVVNLLACTRMSRRHDLLQNVLFELGQPYRDMSEGELRLALIDYLKPSAQCPNGILILVDDGYTLSNRLLDELRLITNFVRDGQPRVRLVIAGTHALEEKLNHPQLESLNQRIAARCYLQGFRRDEIEPYIRHQIVRAGCPNPDVFQTSAINAVIQLCDGNPRTINQICDHALILAASCGQTSVNGDVIAEAFSDIQQLPTGAWIPTSESNLNTGAQNSESSSSVIEFGQISDEPGQDESTDSLVDTEVSASQDHVGSIESISASVDEFSKLVESLANLDAECGDEESDPAIDLEEIKPAPEANDGHEAHDPFAEPFAEEFSIHDNYAELAARQNRTAMLMTEQDVSRLELHLKKLQNEIAIAPTHLSHEHAGNQVIFASSSDTEATPKSLEYPIVDHFAYQLPNEAEFEALSPSAQSATDDRDMLIVSQIQPGPMTPSSTTPFDHGGVSVSRGQAVRLNYDRLFQQLRGGDAAPSTSTRK